MEQALDYAQNRVQFGTPILSFPRVADKIAMMAVEIMIARQLTYYAAREGFRPPLRPRSGHGEASGRPRRHDKTPRSAPRPRSGGAEIDQGIQHLEKSLRLLDAERIIGVHLPLNDVRDLRGQCSSDPDSDFDFSQRHCGRRHDTDCWRPIAYP
jgi:hypothetical protein